MVVSIRSAKLLVAASTVVIALLFGGSARAVTNGTPDGNGHPYVGSMMGALADGTEVTFCTVTLLAPQVVLTDGHCISHSIGLGRQPDSLVVVFDNPLTWNASGQVNNAIPVASYVVNPEWRDGVPRVDWAVLRLARPVVGIAPAHIAPIGALDSAHPGETVTEVGRGMIFPTARKISSPVIFCWDVPGFETCAGRNVGTYELQSVSAWNIHFNADVSAQTYGTLFSDSGAPNFLSGGDPNAVVATQDFINGNNTSNQMSNRLDSFEAHSFIDPFLH